MSLKEKLQQELQDAIKGKKEREVLTIRQVLTNVLNKEKEKRFKLSKEKPDITEDNLNKESQLTDEEVIEVISSEVKKHKESISEFEKGKRQDLIDKEEDELEILQRYLPEQISEEEIKKIAEEAIQEVGAKEIKDMGKVMAELMPRVKGRADGSRVSKIVKELLET